MHSRSGGVTTRSGWPEIPPRRDALRRARCFSLCVKKIRLRFRDGEVIDAESDDASSQRLGLMARPLTGNNALAWVPFAALKYVQFLDMRRPLPRSAWTDPALQKIVLRFEDGQVVRAFKDEVFSHDGNCLNVMILDEDMEAMCRAIVPYAALKAIFFVKVWDSREPQAAANGQHVVPAH